MFRILLNKADDKHESVLALIVSMKKSTAVADFFEDFEELCNLPGTERVSVKVRVISEGQK